MENQGRNPIQQIEYSPSGTSSNQDNVLSLEALGPVVVNSDGSISRITKWSTLGAQEQARILRVLPARNARRLEALRTLEEGNVGTVGSAGGEAATAKQEDSKDDVGR